MGDSNNGDEATGAPATRTPSSPSASRRVVVEKVKDFAARRGGFVGWHDDDGLLRRGGGRRGGDVGGGARGCHGALPCGATGGEGGTACAGAAKGWTNARAFAVHGDVSAGI